MNDETSFDIIPHIDIPDLHKKFFLDCIIKLPGGTIMFTAANTTTSAIIVKQLIEFGILHTNGDTGEYRTGMPHTVLLTENGRAFYTLMHI